MASLKCIVILSEKSSGSSVLQATLAGLPGVNPVAETPHFENETLYWTKVASILDRPQIDMVNSEVPLAPARARSELIALLSQNGVGKEVTGADDDGLIFEGWRALCSAHAPIFLEKSPHHLCQWSALELIGQARDRFPEIEFLLVGLVRNPMDTLYSQFTRWRSRPEKMERQWHAAYGNLQRLKGVWGERLVIVRYEALAETTAPLRPILEFCGASPDAVPAAPVRAATLGKWRADGRFGFTLSEDVRTLAESFGYARDDLTCRRKPLWPVYREIACGQRSLRLAGGRLKRRMIGGARP